MDLQVAQEHQDLVVHQEPRVALAALEHQDLVVHQEPQV